MKVSKLKGLALAMLLSGGFLTGLAAESTGPGIDVGTKAPEFSLGDQSGKTQTLAGIIGQQKKVALVFYRSADW